MLKLVYICSHQKLCEEILILGTVMCYETFTLILIIQLQNIKQSIK